MLSQWMDQIGQFCMEMLAVASEKIEDISRCVSLHLYISQVSIGRGWGGAGGGARAGRPYMLLCCAELFHDTCGCGVCMTLSVLVCSYVGTSTSPLEAPHQICYSRTHCPQISIGSLHSICFTYIHMSLCRCYEILPSLLLVVWGVVQGVHKDAGSCLCLRWAGQE